MKKKRKFTRKIIDAFGLLIGSRGRIPTFLCYTWTKFELDKKCGLNFNINNSFLYRPPKYLKKIIYII